MTALQRLDYPIEARVHVFVDPRVKTLVDHNRSPVGAAFEVKVTQTVFCIGECRHGLEAPTP